MKGKRLDIVLIIGSGFCSISYLLLLFSSLDFSNFSLCAMCEAKSYGIRMLEMERISEVLWSDVNF